MPGHAELYFHDASAVLLNDGHVVAGVEQERLSRVKHTTAFAGDAARACLRMVDVAPDDLDAVAFHFDEQFIDRELYKLYTSRSCQRLTVRSSRELLADRMREHLGVDLPAATFTFVQHHTAHAYSAYPQSGFADALVVVMDGAGGDNALSVYDGHGSWLNLLTTKTVSHSLGILYLAGTELLGYVLGDEYKVMGLAPHGDPSTYRPVFNELYELRPDGDFWLDRAGVKLAFARAGFMPRRRGEGFTREHRDFAAGLQETLETVAWHVISHWQRVTGHRRLAIAGGVGQNCTLNGKLLRSGRFDDVFVHPAAHDAGAALGAALKVHADRAGHMPGKRLRRVFWGPDLPARNAVEHLLTRWKTFITYQRSQSVERDTAELLAAGRVVGWVQGRSEFGPRALGNRSILADPRPEANRDRVNLMVKRRETYRPFAPSIQAEKLRDYFEFPAGMPAPDFMVFTVPVRAERRAVLGAVTHVDGTARIHPVDRDVNPRFWRLLDEFGACTGVPVLLNTSFNNHAEPIVDSVQDALNCYLTTQIDDLVIDDLIVSKQAWTDTDLCDLAPTLVPTARLRTEQSPDGTTSRTVTFTYRSAREVEVDAATYEVLARADGRLTLRALGVENADVLTAIQELWSERFVTLAPV